MYAGTFENKPVIPDEFLFVVSIRPPKSFVPIDPTLRVSYRVLDSYRYSAAYNIHPTKVFRVFVRSAVGQDHEQDGSHDRTPKAMDNERGITHPAG
jgi:hypothetical protein